MKLLVDENFPAPATEQLRKLDVQILSISENCPGISDEAVLKLAIAQDAWLVTFDLDFGELIFQRQLPAPRALIVLREAVFKPSDLVKALLDLIAQANTLENHFVIWTRERVRFRPFPQLILPQSISQ